MNIHARMGKFQHTVEVAPPTRVVSPDELATVMRDYEGQPLHAGTLAFVTETTEGVALLHKKN